MSIKPVLKANAYESVRDGVIALIQNGELRLGDRLPSENKLALAFSVSRPVIREALGSLRAMGLVRSETGRGTYVAASPREKTPPSPEGSQAPASIPGRGHSILALHEVRTQLEVPGAGLAAVRHTLTQEHAIREAMESFEHCQEDAECTDCDTAFHMAVSRATGNEVQCLVLSWIRNLMVSDRQLMVRREWAEALMREHRTIYDAIVARDGKAAARAMDLHLRKTNHRLLARLAADYSGSQRVLGAPQKQARSWLDGDSDWQLAHTEFQLGARSDGRE